MDLPDHDFVSLYCGGFLRVDGAMIFLCVGEQMCEAEDD
jgi:hypothetical protein